MHFHPHRTTAAHVCLKLDAVETTSAHRWGGCGQFSEPRTPFSVSGMPSTGMTRCTRADLTHPVTCMGLRCPC